MVKGRGRGRGYFRPKLICQVCGKTGHSALQCSHRFDYGYQGFTSPAYTSSVPPQATFPSQSVMGSPAQALLAASFMPTRSSNVPYHGFFGSPYNVTSQLPQHTHEFPGISHAQSGGSQQYPSTLHQLSNASQHVTSSLTNSASYSNMAHPLLKLEILPVHLLPLHKHSLIKLGMWTQELLTI